MAELAAVSGSQRAEEVGVVRVRGRLTAVRRFEKSFYTFVTLPAVDAFSHPQVVEVRSDERLGDLQDDVDLRCRIGGFNRKPYKFTDKETGEQRMVTQNVVTLTLI